MTRRRPIAYGAVVKTYGAVVKMGGDAPSEMALTLFVRALFGK
jgi:hypothetical protein